MLHQLSRKDVNETFQVRSALESYCTLQISRLSKAGMRRNYLRNGWDYGKTETRTGFYPVY